MVQKYAIPKHLPDKLTISFWLWNYFYGIKDGDVFHNLEKCFIELKERGFNTIRVDSGAGLCHTVHGKPRGTIALREPFGRYSTLRQLSFKPGGCRCDVLKRVVELFELARKYDVYVILSSWFYLHTFWFADDNIRDELFAVPPERRFMRFAQECDRLLTVLKEKGLHSQVAYVEILNEVDNFPYQWGMLSWGVSDDEKKVQTAHQFRKWHEDALAFIQERHSDILFAVDTAGSEWLRPEILPRNAQLWNRHLYYSWSIYASVLEHYTQEDSCDLQHLYNHPQIGHFFHKPLIAMEDVMSSRNNDCRVGSDWYHRVWLYNNLAADALPALDRLFGESLSRNLDEYKACLEKEVIKTVETRDCFLPNRPLVVGEAATYCPHMGMRWEEKSDDYWSLVKHAATLFKQNGYWGCTPRTNSGPEDPVWIEFPDRLREANQMFLQ